MFFGKENNWIIVSLVIILQMGFGFKVVVRDFLLYVFVKNQLIVIFEYFGFQYQLIFMNVIDGMGYFEFQLMGDGVVMQFFEEDNIIVGELFD